MVLTRGTDEPIVVGQELEVRVVRVRGKKARLGIIAPRSVAVHRKEVFDAIGRQQDTQQER